MLAERAHTTPGQVVVIAHRARILRQLHKIIEKHTGEPVGLLMDRLGPAQHYTGERIVCAGNMTDLTALRRPRETRLVIADEAHHCLNSERGSYVKRLQQLGVLDERREPSGSGQWVEGFTATAQRGDKRSLDLFERCVANISLPELIASGDIAQPIFDPRHSEVWLDTVSATAGDFRQDELAAAVNVDPRTELAIDAWRSAYRDRQFMAFGVDIAHCMSIARICQAHRMAVGVIHGGNSRYPGVSEDEREMIFDAIDAGNLDGVISCDALTEGIDLPTVQVILDLAPTLSSNRAQQKWGRGLRSWELDRWLADDHVWQGDLFGFRCDKPNCVLVDIVDNSRRHPLQSAPSVLGIDGRDAQAVPHAAPGDGCRDAPDPRAEVRKPGWEPCGTGWVFTAADGRCAFILPEDGRYRADLDAFGAFSGPCGSEEAAFRYADSELRRKGVGARFTAPSASAAATAPSASASTTAPERRSARSSLPDGELTFERLSEHFGLRQPAA